MILSVVDLRMLTIVYSLCVSIERGSKEGTRNGYKLI